MSASPAVAETLPATAPRYQLERRVGAGSLGEVFQAWDMQLRRRVAIKRFVAPVDLDGQSADASAWHEAMHLAAVQHPNIVAIYDLGADEEGPFVVMELVEGETLEDVVARGAFPLADFLALARQALEGLAAAHGAGLLHHDLKPGNLMLKRGVTGSLQVKILDFGLSQAPVEAAESARQADQSNVVLGTIEFLPPEVFEREPFDLRGDLYALGCIFYYTLAGRCPFMGKTAGEVVRSHLGGVVTPLAQVRPDLPPALCGWVMRLISRQPDGRPAGACEAIRELEALSATPPPLLPKTPPAAEQTPAATLAPPPPAQRRQRRGGATGKMATVGLAALLAGVGVGETLKWPVRRAASESAAPGVIHPPPLAAKTQIAPTATPGGDPALKPGDVGWTQPQEATKIATPKTVSVCGRGMTFDQDGAKTNARQIPWTAGLTAAGAIYAAYGDFNEFGGSPFGAVEVLRGDKIIRTDLSHHRLSDQPEAEPVVLEAGDVVLVSPHETFF